LLIHDAKLFAIIFLTLVLSSCA